MFYQYTIFHFEDKKIKKYLHLTNKDETDFIKPKWGVYRYRMDKLANDPHNAVKFFLK